MREIKLSLFIDEMTIYLKIKKNPEEFTSKLLEPLKESAKVLDARSAFINQ